MQTIIQFPNKINLLVFGLFTIFLKICMQIHSVVFALSRQINKQKYAKTSNLLCEGNKNFLNIQLKVF